MNFDDIVREDEGIREVEISREQLVNQNHYADLVEEHEAKERIFEEAILISELVFDTEFCYKYQSALKPIQNAVHHYQQIHQRNDEIRREEERLRQVMLS
jgi:hypothetical protein